MNQQSNNSFHLLTVCTGNICRSPLAEALFQDAYEADPDVYVSSAGLEALVGFPMDEQAAKQLVRLGGNPDDLFAEQFEDEHARSANLILTMSLAQRQQITRDFPRAALRTFTLVEFAEIAVAAVNESGSSLPLAGLLAYARKHRGSHKVDSSKDVQDPFRQPDPVHEATADHIHRLAQQIIHASSEAR